jgi:hypothetical protein
VVQLHHINISIDNPCGENFAAMDKTSHGNYCSACKTEVVDFTKMTDAQVLNYLQRKNFNVPCGRFRGNQLDRKILNPNPEPFINWSKLRGAFYALFLMPLSFFKVSGQSKTNVQKIELSATDTLANELFTISIKTIDIEGVPINQCEIFIPELNKTFETEYNEWTKIELPKLDTYASLTFIIKKRDYQFEKKITKSTNTQQITFIGLPIKKQLIEIETTIFNDYLGAFESTPTYDAGFMQNLRDKLHSPQQINDPLRRK